MEGKEQEKGNEGKRNQEEGKRKRVRKGRKEKEDVQRKINI